MKSAGDSQLVDALAQLEAALASQNATRQALIHSRYAERFAALTTSVSLDQRAQAVERLRREQAAELAALAQNTTSRRISERRALSKSLRDVGKTRMAATLRRQRLERAAIGMAGRSLLPRARHRRRGKPTFKLSRTRISRCLPIAGRL